jgi:hypothetical protein
MENFNIKDVIDSLGSDKAKVCIVGIAAIVGIVCTYLKNDE